jgi:hypothetical protein
MASQHIQRLTPKQQAMRDLELARAELAQQSGLVADEWSPRAVMARSFERYRVAWIAGGVVAGLAVLKLVLPSSSRAVEDDYEDADERPVEPVLRSAGLISRLTLPLVMMGRKAVLNYGMQFVQSWLQKRSEQTAGDSNPPVV